MADFANTMSGALSFDGELDRVVDRFELAWRTGVPNIAEFLSHPYLSRHVLILELALVDLEQRLRKGKAIPVEVYFSEFPELENNVSAALELICSDFTQRLRYGESVRRADYLERFPRWREGLETRLHAQLVDGEIRSRKRQFNVHCQNPEWDASPWTEGEFKCPICGSELALAGARFEVLRRLGSGAMGVVYAAFDRHRNMNVALKLLPHGNASALYLFKQEFRSLADISHPNLLPLYELIADGTHWFITMERVDGVDFLNYVRYRSEPADGDSQREARNPSTGVETKSMAAADSSLDEVVSASPGAIMHAGRCDFGRLRNAGRQLAAGLMALHDAGKLHRDIKPSNVLVRHDGHLAVLDFGLATEIRETDVPLPEGSDDSWFLQRTQPGIVGTVAYMSPEQAAGQPLTSASDWYSVGVMLYLSLTGRLPIMGSSAALLRDKQRLDPPPPAEIEKDVPEDLSELCCRLLRRDPAQRPTGAEVLAVFDNAARADAAALVDSMSEIPTLFGRSSEMRQLREAFADVLGGKTVVVHVHGRSGMGKSLLLARLLYELERVGDTVVLSGRCFEQESVPFKTLDSLVDSLSHYLAGISREKIDAIMPRDIAALARVFPVLQRNAVVSEMAACGVRVRDLQDLRRRAFVALRELLSRLGSRRTLVLAMDDLQWGDVEGAQRLVELLQPPDAPRLLLVLLYRSESLVQNACLQVIQELNRESPDYRSLVLGVDALTPESSRELAAELLARRSPWSRGLAGRIASASQGNPFFINELVRSVLEGGWADRASSEEIDLDTVLWSRIERLAEDCRKLLSVIAIADQPLSLRDACEAAGLASMDHQLVMSLRTAGLIRSDGNALAAVCETYHDRVRECVRRRLSAGTRRELHQSLASTLEAHQSADPETIGVHFLAAGDSRKAARYYRRAAESADQALAFARAIKLYRLSMRLDPPMGDSGLALRLQLADALANDGLGVEAAETYLAAAADALGPEKNRIERRAAYQYYISGRIDDGARVLQRLLQAFGLKLHDSRLGVFLRLVVQRALLALQERTFLGGFVSPKVTSRDLERVDVTWEASISLTMIDTLQGALFQTCNLRWANSTGDPERMARALCWHAAHVSTRGQGTRATVHRLLDRAKELRKSTSSDYLEALAELSSGITAYFLGEWEQSTCKCASALLIFREKCRHVSWEMNTAQAFWLWSLAFRGEVKAMGDALPKLLEEAKSRGNRLSESSLANFGGPHVWMARDEPDRAADVVKVAMQMWPDDVFHAQHFTSLAGLTQVDLYSGRVDQAFERIESHWRRLRASHFLQIEAIRIFMRHLRGRCRLALASRGVNRATLLAEVARDVRRLEGETAPWAKGMALVLRAGVDQLNGAREPAADRLIQAINEFARSGMQLYEMSARRVLGSLRNGNATRESAWIAESWMRSQEIVNPDAMTALHCPGFEKG